MATAKPIPRAAAKEVAGFIADFARFAGRNGIRAVGLALCSAVLEAAGLLAVLPLLTLVAGSQHSIGRGLILAAADRVLGGIAGGSPFGRLASVLFLFSVIACLRSIVLAARQNIVVELQVGFLSEMQLRVVRALARAPWQRIAGLQHARVNYVLTSDIYQVGQAGVNLVECAVAIIILTVQVLVAVVLSPAMTLFCAIFLLAGVVAMYPQLWRAHEVGEASSEAHLGILHDTGQFLGSLKLAAGQDLQGAFVEQFANSLKKLNRDVIRFAQKQGANRVIMTVAGAAVATTAGLIGFGVFNISAMILVTLLLVFARISGPVMQLQNHVVELVQSVPAYTKVIALEAELESAAPAAVYKNSGLRLPERDIVFEDVCFLHGREGAERPSDGGVRGLNLVVNRGDFLGITGPSGSGKTTFADLLVGLYGPVSGNICVDGTPGDLVCSPHWRKAVSYVSQDAFMFNDTVRHGLLWANPDADETQIWEALSVSGADAIVRRMPQGLDTIVGERGALVSGGERQRFAITRALLRRPRLLILDEATSAVDPAAEQVILTRLNAMRPELTIVHIAHRLESLAQCNRILLFGGGRVAVEASYQHLRTQIHEHDDRDNESMVGTDASSI